MAAVDGLTLRPYQRAAIETFFREEAAGVKRQLAVLATGLGKTATATTFASEWMAQHMNDIASGGRVLWLTHRNELVDQTLRAIQMWCGAEVSMGVVKAERNELDRGFVVASVQTLAVESRMQQLLDSQERWGEFGLVISDEHHLSPAPTWKGVLDKLGCGTPGGPLMIGLTATPNRSDGVGLKVTTDKITVEHDIIWSIANGYLVPPKGITVKVDLSEVKISRGDYADGSLSDALEIDGAHIMIARIINEHAADRKTICFTPTVRFAELVRDECIKLGYAAEMVSGETPLDERRAMYSRLRSGATKIITNCNVLQEGFDEPSVDCIVNARPTRSSATFTQRVGRGLRLYPGKEDCLVIALAGSERNKLATVASLAGRTWEQAMKAREEKADDVFDFASEFDALVRDEAERAKTKTRAVNLLGERTRITWAVIDDTCFAKSIPRDIDSRDACVIVKQDWRTEEWRVVGAWKSDGQPRYKVLLDNVDITTAQGFADDTIRQRVPNALLDSKARWRRQPATVGQRDALQKWKVSIPTGSLTAGDASDLLDRATLARVAARA